MTSPYLSHFTPSLLSHEALKAVFVQRGGLLKRLRELASDSARSDAKHHALLVGPRGIGKTHLISLLYHELMENPEMASRLVIAWLREEEWGVTSFFDLLLRILRSLTERDVDPTLPARIDALFDLKPAAATAEAASLVRSLSAGKTLLILAENLDDMFSGLGDEGQKRFRSLIQEEGNIAVIASTPALFNGISRRAAPFFQFFRVYTLESLSLPEAVELVEKSVLYRGDKELARILRTPHGRKRIRVIHHIAGGNPRVYAIFAQFLTCESIEEMVNPVLRTLDDLTPYYQAKMQELSDQQRKIVGMLCERRGAIPVKEIARLCMTSPQTASSQLRLLKDRGYLRSDAVGRESYYELAEPLMRLCVELKKNRGGPIRLLVDFLRFWFSVDELKSRLSLAEADSEVERLYLAAALEVDTLVATDPRLAKHEQSLLARLAEGAWEFAIADAQAIVDVRGNEHDWRQLSKCYFELLDLDNALRAIDRAISADPFSAEFVNFRGCILHKLGKMDESLRDFEAAAAIAPTISTYWSNIALILLYLGQAPEALRAADEALKLDPSNSKASMRKIEVLTELERPLEALAAGIQGLNFEPKRINFWFWCSLVLRKLGFFSEALRFAKVGQKLEKSEASRYLAAVHYYYCGDLQVAWNALRDLDFNLLKWHDDFNNLGVACHALDRFEESARAFEKALALSRDSPHIRLNLAALLLDSGTIDEGILELRSALGNPGIDVTYETGDGIAIVHNLLIRTSDASRWSRSIRIWIKTFEAMGHLTVLGQGLATSVPIATSEWLPLNVAESWLATWKQEAAGKSELELPIRLLEAAVTFRKTMDRRALLALPLEERQLLEPLLRVRTLEPRDLPAGLFELLDRMEAAESHIS